MACPWQRLALVVLVGALTACTNTKPKPTPLESFQPKLTATTAWKQSISKVSLSLLPVVRDGLMLVADDGAVHAFKADDGSRVWRAEVKGGISAGVGSDGRWTAVVTRGNEVVVLEQGREVWRKRVPSAVVTAPLVAGERVFVMGVDRAVHAFDAADGRRLWVYSKPGEALTLAQSSVVMAYKDTLLVAQAQRLVALDPNKGTLVWDAPMATPRGTNEVERLSDLLGPAVRLGDRICARAFQSAVACADASKGTVLWSRTVGGVQAIGSDNERIYGADATDRITAWRASNGDVVWTNERMLHRGLSGALAVGANVVFGDSEGFVHFLAGDTGQTLLRLPTDGKAVVGTPVLTGNTLLVVTRGGGIYAFRAAP